MVMDATQPQQPSPQSVGREFVRQYYTLLNKAPNHLHRFYNNNSSFIHGESTLVVGQKNIHNRIQQLNFHDCHAKISQVDAQATLGNGVVVQVTGELSNDGQPMRRFTQTFVLAAQSPKKYYVHNDIFRYQDLYSEEENDGETRSENDEEHEQPISISAHDQVAGGAATEHQQQPQQQLPAQTVATSPGVLPQQAQVAAPQQAIYYSMPAAGGRPVPVLTAPQGATVALGAQFATAGATGIPPQNVQSSGVGQLNGVIPHDNIMPGLSQQQPNSSQQPLVASAGSPVIQPTAAVSVAATVLAGSPVAVAALPVVGSATVPQNIASGAIQGFQQQTPMMQQHIIHQTSQQQPMLQPQTSQVTASNSDLEESATSNQGNISPNNNDTVIRTPSAVITSETTSNPAVEDFKTINEQQQQEKYDSVKQQQNEPKTYANLLKSTSSSPSGFVNAVALQQQQQQLQQQPPHAAYQSNSTISTTNFSQSTSTSSISIYNNRSNESSSTVRIDNNNINAANQGGPLPQRSSTARINKEFEQRRTSNSQQFGDNQQLFLGNIPHHASEDELKGLFARFGRVLELRILSKPGSKLPPGVRNPLNYGFITYEDPESVQTCLASCPLYFPENAPDGQKLNVEEKKPRIRTNDMPPRQSLGNSINNNMNNSQRNSMGGGGAQSRALSNSGGGSGIMRSGNNTTSNSMPRGSSGGARIGGAYNRNGPSNGGGQPVRGGNNNAQSGGGSSFSGRR